MESYDLFEILVREHASMLTAYIRSLMQDPGAVEDVWQETMLVAWRRLDEFDRKRPFGPWLRGIATRVAMANRRSAAKWVVLEDGGALEYLEGQFERLHKLQGDTFDEKLDALRDCVERLSPAERECIQMRFAEELKPAEMSQRMGLGLESVKKRLFRAKRQLSACLQTKFAAEGGVS